MKRFALIWACALLTAVALLGSATKAQKWYFYESFNAVTVNAAGAGNIPAGFTLYNDENTPYDGKPNLSHFDQAWKVIRDISGEGKASAPSLFKNEEAVANRWLVTPAISLSGAVAPKLYFRAKADDERALDGFVLKVSTTTNEVAAFTKNIRTVREARATWTDYVFDLKEYAGKTIYLAFVQNSSGNYTISIDDIRVAESGVSGVAAACNNAFAPLYMIHTPQGNVSFPVTATLQNWGSQPITGARLNVRIKDDARTVSKTLSGLNIAAATSTIIASKTIKLDFVPGNEDDDAQIEIWFDQINGGNTATEHSFVPCYIAKESDMPCKKVMMEIFSSSTCSNCGPWNKAFHKWDTLSNVFGKKDGFIVAKFQVDIPTTGDKLVTEETLARSNFYGINSAPSWYMNGHVFDLIGGAAFEKTLNGIAEATLAFRREVVPFDLSVKLSRDGNDFKIETKTEPELPFLGNYRLYIALCEDSVHFAKAGMSEEKDFFNVVRKMIPDEKGLRLAAKQPTEENNDFETTHTYTVSDQPVFYGDLDKVGVVAYIQNEDTREIIQAAFAKGNGEWSENALWLNDKKPLTNESTPRAEEAVEQAMLYPNPAGEEATLKFRALGQQTLTVCVLDLQGRVMWREVVSGGSDWRTVTLPTSGLNAGLYIVRMESADGRTSVKLLKK